MIGELANHLWQSTVFAGAAALLALACRSNEARVRYWLWLAASLKFLVPIALLARLGSRLQWAPAAQQMAPAALSSAVVQLSQPFAGLAPAPEFSSSWSHSVTELVVMALFAVWVSGAVGIALVRIRAWRRVRALVGASTPRHVPGLSAEVEVRSAPGLMEPGVVGVRPAILLVPSGIEDHLTPRQLAAVFAHELCHVRRRDNLTATMHMLVETLFWFHPVVWWIGAQLIQERERACDEEVLRLGGDPQVYAEGIVAVCRRYAEAPLVCVAGVTGSDLKQRIVAIMKGQRGDALDAGRRLLLGATALAAIAVPIVLGVLQAPILRAQSAAATTALQPSGAKVEVASIKRNRADGGRRSVRTDPGGRFVMINYAIGMLIRTAYPEAVEYVDGPDWVRTEAYDVTAVAVAGTSRSDIPSLLQALLAERFNFKAHYEMREQPTYDLVLARAAQVSPALKKVEIDCEAYRAARDRGDAPELPRLGNGMLPCTYAGNYLDDVTIQAGGTSMARFAEMIKGSAGRVVFDRTGLAGYYEFQLTFNPDPDANTNAPPLPTALQEQLGLKLESSRRPVRVLVVEHIDRPSEN